MAEKRYNLLDEAWIPIADMGKAGLLRVFGGRECRALGGTAVQKIALLKLLIAIAQAAATPQDTQAWAAMGPDGLGAKCVTYLETWRDAFWLYGDRPFLQMPACSRAEHKSYGTVMSHVASGNTTLLTHLQREPVMSDASRALLLVGQMGFALGGKKPDHKVVLSKGYAKGKTAKPGPSLCHRGLLHSFLLGDSILETVWLNLLTRDVIASIEQWKEGLGTAPWEKMPEGEDCSIAQALKVSLMGRLVPLSRFCLLEEKRIRFTEGIVHPDCQERMLDPSAAADKTNAKVNMLWVDPEKRPWRQLTALLAFLDEEHSKGFECLNLKMGVPRLTGSGVKQFGIWSGGLKVSYNSGEQYVTGSDDCVESAIWLETRLLTGDDLWFIRLKEQVETLENKGVAVYRATRRYFADLKAEALGDRHAAEASGLFWQLVEPTFQQLVLACGDDGKEQLARLMRMYAGFAGTAFDESCPRGTARQLEAWARHRPGFRTHSRKTQSS